MKLLLLALLTVMVPFPSTPEAVVREFYSTIVRDKPLGIPESATKNALWPYMTPRLAQILDSARACEADYVRQHAGSDEKPEYWWLEAGLFSGENEMALPAKFEIVNSEALGGNRHRVTLRFTYEETLETTGRAPDPAASFQWRSAVIVECAKQKCLVDDFVPFDIDTAKPLTPLSERFTACRNGKWVGR